MDTTRRTVLAATATAGLGVIAYSLRQGADVSAPADGIRIVPGTNAASAGAAAPAAADPAMAPWQRLVGQRMVLSSGGTGLAVTVAAVTALAPTVMAVPAAAPGRSGFLRTPATQNAGRVQPVAAALPAGVRAQGFTVLFDVHSGEAPVADMLMDLDRAVEGLSRVFVQPATAAAGVPRVIAYFN